MAQLVRGEQEPLSPPAPEEAASPDSSSASKETNHDDSDGNHGNAGHPKKPAWSRPLNGVVSVSGPPVMGDAVAWPALSEATKAPSKSTPDFLNPSESAPAPQTKTDSVNSTQNQKKHANANTNSNPNSTTNPKSPRQRSSKRGGGMRAGPVQNGFIRAPPPPPPLPALPLPPPPPVFPVFEMPYGALPPVPDYFPYNGSNWEGVPMGGFVPPSNSAGYQSSPRNSSRRGNFGGHHNGRSASRSPNVRDVRVPQQIAPPRGFLRPAPPGSIPFLRPHSVGPFGYPMGFDMPFPFVYVPTPPLESFNEVPFTAQASPMPPLPSAVLDDAMRASLVSQIDYYFCDDNLSRDDFLRSKMDDEGWVPISLIAGFPKVQQWTNDVELIFDSLKASSVVEVQPYKVRRRDEWKKWVCTPNRFATGSGFQSTMGSTANTITSSLIKVKLDEAAANESSIMSEADSSAKVVPCSSKSEELTSHLNLANGETL